MDLHAWGQQRAQYSRARRGRNERGAVLGECALVQGVTDAMAIRLGMRRPAASPTQVPAEATADTESRPAA